MNDPLRRIIATSATHDGPLPAGRQRPGTATAAGIVAGILLTLASVPGAADAADIQAPNPAVDLVSRLGDSSLARLATEVLENNPELAALRAQARAAAQRAPQVGSLSDPTLALTAFLITPETRVGPQHATLSVAQRLPWFGKLGLRERAALEASVAAHARAAARALQLVTETRRLAAELAFLDAWETAVRHDRATLSHYEEVARARYASGVGLDQAVVKIQAEITRDDTRLLEIDTRRSSLRASLNALRALPQATPVPQQALPPVESRDFDMTSLVATALLRRPEILAADAAIRAADMQAELAHKEREPDVTLGLTYSLVTRRDDPAGRASPPQDNGRDVLGLTGAVNLPVWQRRIAAAIEEASQHRLAAERSRQSEENRIAADVADLAQRVTISHQQVELLESVLLVQAEQSLRSAEAAYAVGTANALDLLDAERLVLDVHTAVARARADNAVAVARIEGAIAGPLPVATQPQEVDHE